VIEAQLPWIWCRNRPFFRFIFAGGGEGHYRSRQDPTDFLAATDRILAGSGKILPTAPMEIKYLHHFLFL
jgi:hypothetical protein